MTLPTDTNVSQTLCSRFAANETNHRLQNRINRLVHSCCFFFFILLHQIQRQTEHKYSMKYCTILWWSFARTLASTTANVIPCYGTSGKRSCEFFINGLHLRFSEGLSGDERAHILLTNFFVLFYIFDESWSPFSFYSDYIYIFPYLKSTPTHLLISTNCLPTLSICYFDCIHIAVRIMKEKYCDRNDKMKRKYWIAQTVVQFSRIADCSIENCSFAQRIVYRTFDSPYEIARSAKLLSQNVPIKRPIWNEFRNEFNATQIYPDDKISIRNATIRYTVGVCFADIKRVDH